MGKIYLYIYCSEKYLSVNYFISKNQKKKMVSNAKKYLNAATALTFKCKTNKQSIVLSRYWIVQFPFNTNITEDFNEKC